MLQIKLYECQKQFIIDAKKIIGSGGIGVFSSPTGTGKTVSLLIAIIDQIYPTENAGTVSEDKLLELFISGKYKRTKVFYSSKTHAQLSQALNELKRLNILCNSVILGSRRTYCINKKANKYKDLERMNEKCEEMVKDGTCEFYEGCGKVSKNGIIDVEELVEEGKMQKFCPYYVSREYSQKCDVVFLPYQLLFTDIGRRSASIDVHDAIVIVDEAHNIYESVIRMNTASVSFCMIDRCIKVLCNYRNRCSNGTGNIKLLNSTIEILERVLAFRTSQHVMNVSKDEDVMRASEFAIKTRIDDFNMLEVEEYLMKTGLVRKLVGFDAELTLQIAEIAKFLYLLVMSDYWGRIFYNSHGVRLVPLDPSIYFRDVLECKALLLAGGTMEPVDQLTSVFKERRCHYFSYGSVCKNFLPVLIKSAPSGRDIVLNYDSRNNDETIKDVISTLSNLSNTVRNGGALFFLPSKACLEIFKDRCGFCLNGKLVLYEDSTAFEKYSREIKRNRSCILFAVMGGKLSEGVNFGDELCRLLVVVGVPYPNNSVELREGAKLYGDGYSTLIAMRTVNQTLGRALRHEKDYAVLILLDKRYVQLSKFIVPWVRKKIITCEFREAFSRTNCFLLSHDKIGRSHMKRPGVN